MAVKVPPGMKPVHEQLSMIEKRQEKLDAQKKE